MPDKPVDLAIRDNSEQNRFEADLGDGTFAIAEYELLPDAIVFTHTEVPPQHEGGGIGSALIRFALGSARERGLKVVPVCPFFAAYIRKHADEQDLLAPSLAGEARARLSLKAPHPRPASTPADRSREKIPGPLPRPGR
jgi:uncharacterized protein